jgi:hypothetical protein
MRGVRPGAVCKFAQCVCFFLKGQLLGIAIRLGEIIVKRKRKKEKPEIFDKAFCTPPVAF